MINFQGYHVCVLDFVTGENGKFSSTQLWFHIANIIMSKVMLTQVSVDWELLAAYGAVVGGSHAAVLFMRLKYGNRPDTELDQK